MTLRDDLLSDIESRLQATLIPSYRNKSQAWDLFEAFVFSILVEAAVEEGAQLPIQFEDTSGNASSNLLFRRSPGHVNDSEKYVHAVLKFPIDGQTLELEAHLGVYAVGASGVPQECDIALVLRKEGQRCRKIHNKRAVIKSTSILLGVECKCYESSSISLGLGRSFLGLVQDLSSKGRYYFVFNGTKSSVEKLLSHYEKGWEHNLSPSSSKEIERLRYAFQDRLKSLKARV
jgi:hypothetical protein